ncbi:hypothetical protein D3C73_1189240 [compost metagenome]
MSGETLAFLLQRQNHRLLNGIILGAGEQIRMKDKCTEPARAFLQHVGGMNIAGFDEYGLSGPEREIISIDLKQNLAFQQHKELCLFMPVRIQDMGSGRKLNPIGGKREHNITMYTVFFKQTL